MRAKELSFCVQEERLTPLLERLGGEPDPGGTPRVEVATYLDTFDRRVLASGDRLEVVGKGKGVELLWRHGRSTRRARSRRAPAFAPDLPAGAWRKELGARIAPRRLLALCVVERRIREYDLAHGEPEARVRILERRTRAPENGADWHALPTLLTVQPRRGRAADLVLLERKLQAEPALARHEPAELEEALRILDRARTPAESPPPALDPDAPTDAAVRAALAPGLATWSALEDGLRADLDVEFLHQGRVVLRRTRGVLRQLRAALPASAGKELARELRWLAQVSGPQRDLDVLLEEFDGLARELPKGVRADLDELCSAAREERERSRAFLLEALDGARYQALLLAWRAFLEPGAPQEVAQGRTPILALVARRIGKRHARLLKLGKRLSARSPGAAFHELRIECKKLRYLLDAFRSLFPPELVEAALAALKRFQAALGEANDAHVQGERLRQLAEQLHASGRAQAACLMAVGRALSLLAAREKRSRAEFLRRFRAYSHGPELELMEALLASAGRDR